MTAGYQIASKRLIRLRHKSVRQIRIETREPSCHARRTRKVGILVPSTYYAIQIIKAFRADFFETHASPSFLLEVRL